MSNINGTAGSDSLTGSTASDQILGFQGNDTIDGGGGSDTIYGGQGGDGITFGIGNGTSFDQPGANGSSFVVGGEGRDTITSFGGLGNNTVLGGTGNPTTDERLDGGDVIDLTADRGRDIVAGNYGDDTIGIGVGGATAFGGMGNDLISDSGSTVFDGGEGGGGVGNDALQPQVTQSNFLGSANDIIFGGEGEDTIDLSSFGNSTIVGGTGNSAVDVSADGADLIVFDQSATDANNNALIGNNLVLGNYGDDTISASGESFDNQGTFLGFYSDGQAPGGSDTLVGGMGNDAIYAGEQANDIILGNQGNDFVVAVTTETGTDTIYGGLGDDTIVGGNNRGEGQTPNELVYGGEGNDFVLLFGTGNDTLFGGIDSTGGSADGANAFDIEQQVAGNDLIFGGPNSDYALIGTTDAAATVTGGLGADTVSFVDEEANPPDDGGSAFNGSGRDVITDFVSGTDKIDNPDAVQSTLVVGTPITDLTLDAAATQALAAGAAVNPGGVNAVLFQTKAGGDHYLAIDNVNDGGSSGTYDTGIDLLIDLKTTATITGADFLSSANNVQFASGTF